MKWTKKKITLQNLVGVIVYRDNEEILTAECIHDEYKNIEFARTEYQKNNKTRIKAIEVLINER